MNNQPLVSIIMNCYNGEEFLQEAIESVQAQTYKNWELIFWDNQSTDKSAEIFKKYNNPRLKYFYAPEHTLLSEARNKAIGHSSGEFLAFLDVDDWWAQDKLEKQIPLFKDEDVGLVYSNYWYVLNGKNIKYPYSKKILPKGWCIDDILKNYCVGLLTITVRSKIFKILNNGFNPKYYAIEDFDFVLNLSKSWKIDCVQTPLAYFRHHENNNSFILKDKRLTELQRWCKEAKNDSIIGPKKGLIFMVKLLSYQEAAIHIERKNYKAAWGVAKRLKFSIYQLRLLLKIIVPDTLFYKAKYYYAKYL